MSQSTKKALYACLFFASIGTIGWFTTSFGNIGSLPLIVYYGALVVSTFFSIQTFSALTPTNAVQMIFDATLCGIYCALAFSFGSVLLFSLVSGTLFMVSIAKYLHLKRLTVSSSELFRRKIKMNGLSALLSFSASGIAALGLVIFAAWILSSVFALANIYLLLINNMYRPDS